MGNTLRRFQAWLRQNTREARDKEVEIIRDSENPPSTDVPAQQSSVPAADPPPYSQALKLSELPNDNRLSTLGTSTSVDAAVCMAGVTGGPAAARAVAEVISHASHAVAAVPVPEARVAATAMTTAIADYAAAVAEEPGIPFAAIYEQTRNSIPAVCIPAFSEHLPEALSNMDHLISPINAWSRDGVAAAVARAVAKTTNAVATVSPSEGEAWSIAGTWSGAATRVAADVSEAFSRTDSGIQQSSDILRLNPASGRCDAVLQMTRVHAALYAVRDHASKLGHARAVTTLAAVAAEGRLLRADSEDLYVSKCTCGRSPGAVCTAVLEADRLRAVFHALWSYNAMVGNQEAAQALAAVATSAGLSPPPECANIGQNAGSCQTTL